MITITPDPPEAANHAYGAGSLTTFGETDHSTANFYNRDCMTNWRKPVPGNGSLGLSVKRGDIRPVIAKDSVPTRAGGDFGEGHLGAYRSITLPVWASSAANRDNVP